MSAFPFTAPIHTEEDEKAERAAMTEEEKQRVRAEIYGTEIDIVETELMIRNGLDLFQCALDALTPDEKRDYHEAVELVPELVETESPRISFLRAVQYDAWAAARRLVDYWSTRKKIFGEVRAFLPMTLEGAMAEDLQFLEKAVLYALPEDDHQRAVLFIDRIRCSKDVIPRDSVVRCLWYVLQTFVENEGHQRRGFVGISNMRGFDLYKHFDRILTKKLIWVVNCMPIRIRAPHLCTGSGASVTKDVVLPVLNHMVGRDNRLRLQLHAGSTSEILMRFQDYGLGEPHVRAVFGGEGGNRATLQAWLNERRQIEQARRFQVHDKQIDGTGD